jgi:hypothetical protein
MLVLFDNNTPRTLARYLIAHHTITEAHARGWGEMENGDLLDAAEAAGFEVFVTAGQKHPSSAEPRIAEDRPRCPGRRPMERD